VGWIAVNTVGHVKRAITLAAVGSVSGLGAIVSSFAFVSTEAPLYRPGYIICLTFLCVAFALTITYAVSLWLDNRARDAGRYNPPVVDDDDDLADRHVCPSTEKC
jgi:hypothetical protein